MPAPTSQKDYAGITKNRYDNKSYLLIVALAIQGSC